MPRTPSPQLSRRSFLVGTAGVVGAVALSSCSSSGSNVSAGNGGASGATTAPGSALIASFDTSGAFVRAGSEQRLTFLVGAGDGGLAANAPASLDLTVTKSGTPVGPPITVPRHADGTNNPYFPLRFTPDQPGTYAAQTTIDGAPVSAAFIVGSASDVKVPQVGEALIAVDTPTVDDHRGVDPICTRTPQACTLHTHNLKDAIGQGAPIAYLVSTPQFCQTASCGPVLELLLEEHDKRPQFTMIHAEVYKAPLTATSTASADIAPAVAAYNLSYEPALFVATPDGTIVARLDNIFDRAEIKAALDKAAA